MCEIEGECPDDIFLTRSMLCCNLSFPLTASCCLKSSLRGSDSDGGGAI